MSELTKMRAEAGYGSWDEVAVAIFNQSPRPDGLPTGPRSLATKLSELARGRRTWWDRRPLLLQSLAEVIEVDEDALRPVPTAQSERGLLQLPWLPFLDPVDLSAHGLWMGASVVSGSHVPEGLIWTIGAALEGQDFWVRWLTIEDAIERSALAGVLELQRLDVRRFETLAVVPPAVARARVPVVAVVEFADPERDISAIQQLRPTTVALILAAFPPPVVSIPQHKTAMEWDLQERLHRREPNWCGVFLGDCQELKAVRPRDWREAFVRWVSDRAPRGESLLEPTSALGWLARHDPAEWVFRDRAAIAHVLTVLGESGPSADLAPKWLRGHLLRRDGLTGAPEAWLRSIGAEVIGALVEAAWRGDAEPWDTPRSREGWSTLLATTRYAPSSYAMGATGGISGAQGVRTDAATEADHVNRLAQGTGPLPLEGIIWLERAGLLSPATQGLAISPSWLPRWLVRESVRASLQVSNLAAVFDLAGSPSRREAIEGILRLLGGAELSSALAVARKLPAGEFASAVATEMLLREVARRLESNPTSDSKAWLHPEALVELASRVVQSGVLSIEYAYFVPHLITRTPRHLANSRALDLAVDCWTISLAVDPPADCGRASLFPAWHSDGWRELSAYLGPALKDLEGAAARDVSTPVDREAAEALKKRAENECRQLSMLIHAMAQNWLLEADINRDLPLVMVPGVLVAMAAKGTPPPLEFLQAVVAVDWAEECAVEMARKDPRGATRVAAAIATSCARTGRWLAVLAARDFPYVHPLAHFVAEHLPAHDLAELLPEIGLEVAARQWNWLRPELRKVVSLGIAAAPAFDASLLEAQVHSAVGDDAGGLAAVVRSRPGQAVLCSYTWKFLPDLAEQCFSVAVRANDHEVAKAWLDAADTGHLRSVVDTLEQEGSRETILAIHEELWRLIPTSGRHAPRIWSLWRRATAPK